MTAVILVWRDFDRLPSVWCLAPAALLSLLHETAIDPVFYLQQPKQQATMADDEDIAALVIDNGSGMCKGTCVLVVAVLKAKGFGPPLLCLPRWSSWSIAWE